LFDLKSFLTLAYIRKVLMSREIRIFSIIKSERWAVICKSAVMIVLCAFQPRFANGAGGNAVVAVTATVLSKSHCQFRGSTTRALAYGSINSLSNTSAIVTASLTLRCTGSVNSAAYALNHDSGLYESGVNQNRMKHSTLDEYLPYTFTLSPSSGTIPRNVDRIITLTGTVTPANYQDATPGSYADTVVVTLTP
jgi:spore coat protein U-like protein